MRWLGPVTIVKVFGGCLTSQAVENAFEEQSTKRHKAAQRSLAKQLAVAMGNDIAGLHKEYNNKVKPVAQALSETIAAPKPRRRRTTPLPILSNPLPLPMAPSMGLDNNASPLPSLDPFCLSLLPSLNTSFQWGGSMQGVNMMGLSYATPLPVQMPLHLPLQVPMLDVVPSLPQGTFNEGYDIFLSTLPLNPSFPSFCYGN